MRIFCVFTPVIASLVFSSQIFCWRTSSPSYNYYKQPLRLEGPSNRPSQPLCNPITVTQERGREGENQVPFCSTSVEELSTGQFLPGTKFRPSIAPQWMNLTLYKIGQEFANKNLQIVSFTNFIASVFLAMEKDIADILAFTDSNSMNVGIPRFLLTTKLLSILFKTDLKSTTGQAVIFKMRRILENVGHQADAKLAKGCSLISYSKFANASVDTVLWTAFEADLQKSGIVENSRRYSENYLRHREHYCSPLNQFVLANIQFLLAGLPFVAPDILAMTNPTNEELIGWNHMWAVLGHAIGIEDAFNVALQPSLPAAKLFYERFYKMYVIPNIFHLTKESKILVEMLLDAGASLPPNNFLGKDLILIILLQDFLGIQTPKMQELLSTSSIQKLDWWRTRKTFISSFPRTSTHLKMLINNDFESRFHSQWRNWFGNQFMSDWHIAMYTVV